MKVTLIDYTPNGMQKLAKLTMTTRKQDLITNDVKNADSFLKMIIKIGHLDVLEHIYFTFFVSDISRVTTHQLVRHRMASYLQMTNRHVKPDKYRFVIPKTIKHDEKAKDIFVSFVHSAFDKYHELLDLGIPAEDARYLLPPAFNTHITITMNARELRYFFKLRCAEDAQWEIREMAKKMLWYCYSIYPVLFEDLYNEFIDKKKLNKG